MTPREIADKLLALDDLRAEAEYFARQLGREAESVWQQYFDARDDLEAQLGELVVLSLETGRHVLIPAGGISEAQS